MSTLAWSALTPDHTLHMASAANCMHCVFGMMILIFRKAVSGVEKLGEVSFYGIWVQLTAQLSTHISASDVSQLQAVM